MSEVTEYRPDVQVSSEGQKVSGDFLTILRERVSVDDLLGDRKAQSILEGIMGLRYTRHKQEIESAKPAGGNMFRNPYPVLILKGEGETYEHEAFKLIDGEYYYYFRKWLPKGVFEGKVPPYYLRPQDIVPSYYFSRTYPEEVRAKVMSELGITEAELEWGIYMGDPRVVNRAMPVHEPFIKPLCRVPAGGGISELFNYNSSAWEPSGDGVYTPSFSEKVKHFAGKLKRGLSPKV